jgi:hypothetical protein
VTEATCILKSGTQWVKRKEKQENNDIMPQVFFFDEKAPDPEKNINGWYYIRKSNYCMKHPLSCCFIAKIAFMLFETARTFLSLF